MSRKQTTHQPNQAGFSAVEGLLILIIVIMVAGIGYYVYHVQKNSNNTLATAQSTSATSTPPNQVTYLTLTTAKVPTGWKVSTDSVYTKSLVSTDKTSAVIVTQTTQASLKASGAQSFIDQQVKALGKAGAKGVTTTVGAPVQLQIQAGTGTQSITAYPAVVANSTGQPTSYTKTAYVVENGYYVTITESSTTSQSLTQADQALQAISIKE
jgi:hypothetical protein